MSLRGKFYSRFLQKQCAITYYFQTTCPKQHHKHLDTGINNSLHTSVISKCQSKHWDKAVSAAEKVVGYPTSFMNLRFWLSDEMSNVAVNMRKLIGTKHPLMKTAKGLLFDNKENMQTRGLVVLLISKAGGYPKQRREFPHHHLDDIYSPVDTKANNGVSGIGDNGILATQRSLAEIAEMINTAFILHRGVMAIDLSDKRKPYDSETEDLLYGNKMSLLSGDYLLAKASAGLASLGNVYVVEIMASVISDLMESRFYMDDLKNSQSDAKLTLEHWQQLSYKSGASLYAKSCQSALMLSEHVESVTDMAFDFGKHFGFLRQLKTDVDESREANVSEESICNILDFNEIDELKQEYVDKANTCVAGLHDDDAKNALRNIVNALSKNIINQK